jgi:hypothetical protein
MRKMKPFSGHSFRDSSTQISSAALRTKGLEDVGGGGTKWLDKAGAIWLLLLEKVEYLNEEESVSILYVS